MKSAVFILALGIFFASVFSFASMNYINMNCDPGLPNSTCPPSKIGMAFHHISSYNNLIQAVVPPPETGVVLATILFLSLAFVLILNTVSKLALTVSSVQSGEYGESPLSQYRKITRWLSLFENSPAV
ncbi:MAG TPA: hypothetical protein VJJ28_03165 [Candidatus Paceibacterota bacterium]